jgi:hypothetical protein
MRISEDLTAGSTGQIWKLKQLKNSVIEEKRQRGLNSLVKNSFSRAMRYPAAESATHFEVLASPLKR